MPSIIDMMIVDHTGLLKLVIVTEMSHLKAMEAGLVSVLSVVQNWDQIH